MGQQINLYNADLRHKREWLTLGNLVAASLAFALLLGAAGATLRYQTKSVADQAKAVDADLAKARADLVKAAAAANTGGVEAELKSLQESLVARREVLAALRQGAGLSPNATTGFSDYLRGLARQTVNGLWLTGFAVGQGGEGMEIRGRMLVAERLPDYIRRLNGEKVFQGRQFVSLSVERPVEKDAKKASMLTPYNAFVLTAARADDSKGAAK